MKHELTRKRLYAYILENNLDLLDSHGAMFFLFCSLILEKAALG